MNTMQETTRTIADTSREILNTELRRIEKEYWKLFRQLGKEEFPSRWESLQAIKELSELGIAMHELGKAYSSMNTAACITD